MSKRSLFVLLAAMLVVALAACGTPATPTTVPPTTAPAVQPTATKVAAAQPTTAPTTAPAQPTTATTPAAAAPTATPPPPACAKLADAMAPAAGTLGAADKPIVITFVPSGDVATITKSGNALADCMTKVTGVSYKIETGTSYAASIEAIGAGKAQVSFLATFAALLARNKYGVEPALVATRAYATVDMDPDKGLKGQQQPFYKGQFITKKGSPIKTIADLKGKTFCFTDPTSTSGTIIPGIVLRANGINPDKDLKATQFAGSHPNVVAAVYKGDCDAGATFIDARTDASIVKAYPDVMDKVDVFFVTDKIPNDGMQLAKDLDSKLKDMTVKGLLSIMADPGGKAMVRSIYSYDALVQVKADYYDPFGELMKKAGVDPASYVK